MAIVTNSEVLQTIRQISGIQIGKDDIPKNLSNQIIPSLECNPHLVGYTNVVISGSLQNSTSATLAATHSTLQTYITGFTMMLIKDVTATSTEFNLRVSMGGALTTIGALGGLTLTVESHDISIQFKNPMKLDKSSQILLTAGSNVANFHVRVCLYGFLEQTR